MRDATVLIVISAFTVVLTGVLHLPALAAVPGILGVIAGSTILRLGSSARGGTSILPMRLSKVRRSEAGQSLVA